jgi:hypothetical protein
MAEEKHIESIDPTISTDDMSVLRTLLHNIKGISAVSTVTDYVSIEDLSEE